MPALGTILVVQNFFHLRFMEATVPSPDLRLDTILSQSAASVLAKGLNTFPLCHYCVLSAD